MNKLNQEPFEKNYEYEHTPEAYAYAEERNRKFDETLLNENIENSDENLEESSRMTLEEFRNIELPSVLQKRVYYHYLAGIAIGLFVLCLIIYDHDPRYAMGFIITGLFFYNAINLKISFSKNDIFELAVICTNISQTKTRRKKATFQTNEDMPTYFEFYLMDNQNDLIPGVVYIIYFDRKNPHQLLGYMHT